MSRMTREMFCLMEGRHVHPSTLYPGGVGTVPTQQLFTDYLVRLMKYVEFMKKVVPLHDDLFDFFYEALPGYEEVGRRRVLLGCWGSWNDPEVCDYTYRHMDEWGKAMYVTPGVIVDGKAVTHNLVDINLGIRILLGYSYYDDWADDGEMFVSHDPLGNPVDRRHPWNQTTIPRPQKRDFNGKYTWVMCPRWLAPADRRAPGARHRRRPDRPALVDGAGGPGRHRLHQGDRPERQDLPAQDGDDARGRVRVEDPQVEQRHRARPGPDLLPGLRGGGGAATSPSRRWRSCTPAGPGPGPTSRCPTRRSAAASTRRSAACCRTTSSSATARSPTTTPIRRRRGTPARATSTARPAPTRTPCRTRRSSRRTGPTSSRGSTSCGPSAASTRACPAASTCTTGDGKLLDVRHVPMFGVQQSDDAGREATDGGDALDARDVPGAAPAARRPAARASSAWPTRRRGARPREIVQAVLDLHGAGLERILGHLADAGDRRRVLDACARDEVVGGLLLLHGLHPLDLEERVLQRAGAGAALPPLARRRRRAARRRRRRRAAAAGGQLPRLPVVGGDHEADDRGGDPRPGPRRRSPWRSRARPRRPTTTPDGRPLVVLSVAMNHDDLV